MKSRFDWRGGVIDQSTLVDHTYRNTQNVRGFFIDSCGPSFKFDRDSSHISKMVAQKPWVRRR